MEYKSDFEEAKRNDDEFYERLSSWYYPEYKKFLENEGALPKEFEFIPNPFGEYLNRLGLDGLTDRSNVSCWLRLTEPISMEEAVKICLNWKKIHISFYENIKSTKITPMRSCQKKIVIILDFDKELPEISEELRHLCKDENIRIAVVKTETTLYDLIIQNELSVRYEEYPGSADDAATYGNWYLL